MYTSFVSNKTKFKSSNYFNKDICQKKYFCFPVLNDSQWTLTIVELKKITENESAIELRYLHYDSSMDLKATNKDKKLIIDNIKEICEEELSLDILKTVKGLHQTGRVYYVNMKPQINTFYGAIHCIVYLDTFLTLYQEQQQSKNFSKYSTLFDTLVSIFY